ncbi:hypothetical protein MPF_1095 [Methanohalophilus portucalensis FDF-1]|uniref:Uncharacterized protein n=1 Tax=Methanohalophilus portucalensis FDF-1 TaxID=523843 RepID=A0A1L9C474_9EURY|nr:hypothetical protein MPF_1095 [Methanohalophilus portucalensis FDF-1]
MGQWYIYFAHMDGHKNSNYEFLLLLLDPIKG